MQGRIKEKGDRMELAVLGMIKIGMKNDKGYPVSLDHFLCKSDIKKYEQKFQEVMGEKPNVIEICFASDDPRECCNERYELRDKDGKLFCESDGESYTTHKDGEKTMYLTEWIVENYGDRDTFEKKLVERSGSKSGFKRKLTLTFLIPKLKGLIGVWKLSTYADKSSIDQIIGTFDNILRVAGRVNMIPFDLSVKKQKRQSHGQSVIYSTISLICNATFENIAMLSEYAGDKFELLTDDKIKQLKEGKHEN